MLLQIGKTYNLLSVCGEDMQVMENFTVLSTEGNWFEARGGADNVTKLFNADYIMQAQLADTE